MKLWLDDLNWKRAGILVNTGGSNKVLLKKMNMKSKLDIAEVFKKY